MSSGPFQRTFYELNNGEIAAIRVQPETLALTLGGTANAAPAGPASVPSSAVVSRGRRSRGINARLVRIVFDTPPAGYKADSVITLPWLQDTSFDNLEPNDTGTYLGSAVTLIGKTAEAVR